MSEKKLIPVPFGSAEGWAFIVGISQYQDQSLNLQYAHRDADELYKFLLSPSGICFDQKRIIKLTNEDATTGELYSQLRKFLTKPDREDLVLLYFSCHGAPNPRKPEDLYLLTHDTERDDIPGTAYPMGEIYSSLQETLLAEKVIILADTCHSGAIGISRGIKANISDYSTMMNAYWSKLSQSRGGIALFTSAQNRELSREDAKWGGGHGVFTHYLLEGMRGKASNDEGIVTIQNLFEYVRHKVKKATNNNQHPMIGPFGFDSNLPLAIVPNFESISSTKTKEPINRTRTRVPPQLDITDQTMERINKMRTRIPHRLDFTVDLGNDIKLEMVYIKGGTFRKANTSATNLNLDRIHLSDFYISKRPINAAQYQAIMGKNPSLEKNDNRPIDSFTYNGAQEFCRKLSSKTGKHYTLPSQEQLQYAFSDIIFSSHLPWTAKRQRYNQFNQRGLYIIPYWYHELTARTTNLDLRHNTPIVSMPPTFHIHRKKVFRVVCLSQGTG